MRNAQLVQPRRCESYPRTYFYSVVRFNTTILTLQHLNKLSFLGPGALPYRELGHSGACMARPWTASTDHGCHLVWPARTWSPAASTSHRYLSWYSNWSERLKCTRNTRGLRVGQRCADDGRHSRFMKGKDNFGGGFVLDSNCR